MSVVIVPSLAAHAAAPAANKTEILFDGQQISGLKGFTYKVYKDRQDVRGIGMNERIGVLYGRLHVKGKILVHSNSELLNEHMDNNTSFQIMQDSYPEGLGIKQFTFRECTIDAVEYLVNPAGLIDFTVYSFTCAGVSGAFPTEDGMITPGYLNREWELDDDGVSLNTAAMVTKGAELTEIKVDVSTFEEALAYQLYSHGYDITKYTFTADRIREA